MKGNKDYFELGRGAKLIPQQYWHQYVLGIDLSLTERPFIVAEVGKTEILYQKELNIIELAKSEWNELLKVSKTETIIETLKKNIIDGVNIPSSFYKKIYQIIAEKELIEGNWISINEYHNLNYDSNFGNWVDAVPTRGKLKFSLDLKKEIKNCIVDIPVNYYSVGSIGYYSMICGTFQLCYNKILVWQNEIFPVNIEYELKENTLVLNLFGNEIQFIRE